MPEGDDKSSFTPAWLLEFLKVAAMPIVTLVVGAWFNASLNQRQTDETNTRLYADMMGRREEADSALRKDMFRSILDTFMQKDANMKSDQYLDQQVLDIELLAYNFHESLDLGPLFRHVRRQIQSDEPISNAAKRERLEKVAGEVNERQLTILSDSGAVIRGSAELNQVQNTASYLSFSGPFVVADKEGKPLGGAPRMCLQLNPSGGDTHYRLFQLEVIDYNPKLREFQARMYASRPIDLTECRQPGLDLVAKREIDTTFWIGHFDFPMIDNTRLSLGERCAVSMTGLTPDSVEVALSYFPGSRASLKDKPYYDELMHELLRSEKSRKQRKP